MDFNAVVERAVKRIESTLTKKATEYATSGNRFHNFDVAGRMLGESAEKALWGFVLKHIVSVKDMIDDPSKITYDMIDEKIGDIINYMVLLEGLMRRRVELTIANGGKQE